MLAEAPILLQSTPIWIEVEIEKISQLTPTIKSLRFRVPWGATFRAGQAVDFRLTAEDGYSAQRYYSIATAPCPDHYVEVMVERKEGGEVSSFFHDTLEVGDKIEVRGPIGGGPFTWQPSDPGPIMLIGGGSGVVPLLSMLRHRHAVKCSTPFTLIYSAKQHSDVLMKNELREMSDSDHSLQVAITLTREKNMPPGFNSGRVSKALIAGAFSGDWSDPKTCFICGSNSFVGDICDLLLELGMPMHQVRTERFGG
nr:ferredoxin reductase [Burkholderia sp. Ac-20353]